VNYKTITFDGSIGIGIQENSTTKAKAITLNKLPKEHVPGEELSWDDLGEPICAMEFKTVESIDVMIKALNYLKERLNK